MKAERLIEQFSFRISNPAIWAHFLAENVVYNWPYIDIRFPPGRHGDKGLVRFSLEVFLGLTWGPQTAATLLRESMAELLEAN